MSRRSTLMGSLEIQKRADTTGGDLYVAGTLSVNCAGEAIDILSLASPVAVYEHQQTENSAVWSIPHPLNTSTPLVRVFIDGKETFSRIAYETAAADSINVHFATPCVGLAILYKLQF